MVAQFWVSEPQLGPAGQAGARYFVSDRFSLQGQIGFGYGTLGLGATWML